MSENEKYKYFIFIIQVQNSLNNVQVIKIIKYIQKFNVIMKI